MSHVCTRLAVLAVALVASACSLFPEPTPDPTYHVAAETTPVAVPTTSAAGTALRLSRVTAAPSIGERFAFTTGSEMRFDEFQRWHEPPEVTLERRLAAHLFERLGLARSSAASAPFLQVELVRHEVDLDASGVLVRAHVSLTDGSRRVLAERTIDVRTPLVDTSGAAIAEATGDAVDGLVARIVALVTSTM